jgi:hypothetical protein
MPQTTIKLNTPARQAQTQRAAKEAELNGHGANGHGGARDGAGRKPKALYYARELADAEGKIIAALPDLIEQLITNARHGDTAAAKYLLDRVFGRVKEQAAPPADDISLPYSEADAEFAKKKAESSRTWEAMAL